MASPYILTNVDLQLISAAGQDFSFYVAFLNPVSVHTNWSDLSMDSSGNWQPPPNVDTLNLKVPPYAPTSNLGPNRIGFVGEFLYFDGTRSCQRFDLPVVSYKWSVTGMPAQTLYYHNGSQVGYQWNSPGLYSVTLTVTDRYGSTAFSTRQVMIYQDRQSALPGVIALSGLSGSIANMGWQCQLTTVNSQITLFPPDQLPVGTYQPVVIMCETRYEVIPGVWVNQTIAPHGTFSPGYPYQDPRILMDGYIQNGTIHQDVDKDTLSFVCQGPQLILNEAQTHQVGYYNATTKDATHLNTSSAGQGFLCGGLMTADVIHALLQDHANIGQYHDIHIWNSNIPTAIYQPGNSNPVYNPVYTNLSVNTGTIAQNINDLATNEWAQCYCDHDGSIRVGPQVNYRGSDYWQHPTLLGAASASTLINYIQDLGYTLGDTPESIQQTIPVLPSQPMPVEFVHPWGNQPLPPSVLSPFGTADPTIVQQQQGQNGPPILCHFSDTPVYDQGTTIPGGASGILFPWITANWPQDIAVYPLSFDFPMNYTGRTSLVKLIGTLFGGTSVWSSWWPQSAFAVTGNGSGSLVTTQLPTGQWMVDTSKVLPDGTTSQNVMLMNNWWWEMARRVFYAANINYTGTVTTGMFTPCSLSDVVLVTRQQNSLGPHWLAKPFYVTEIDYAIDFTNRTWTTTMNISEVTSILLGPITTPPTNLPRGYY